MLFELIRVNQKAFKNNIHAQSMYPRWIQMKFQGQSAIQVPNLINVFLCQIVNKSINSIDTVFIRTPIPPDAIYAISYQKIKIDLEHVSNL